VSGKKWKEALAAFNEGDRQVLTEAFMEAYGDRDWLPNSCDAKAAALLHLELTSRVATQEIGYSSGDEVSALESVHALFERTRVICRENTDARVFETIAWFVLNHYVRPFTSRWHRRRVAGRLAALDETDDFRLQLEALRGVLRDVDRILSLLRGEEAVGEMPRQEATAINQEMGAPLPWGLDKGDPNDLEGVGGLSAVQMAPKERETIEQRRKQYGLNPAAERATGLALSGGGIRSATFALGALTVLANRGLLNQFDYLSTVSGGGYLGAFLVNFLAAGEGAASAGANNAPGGDRDASGRGPDTPVSIGLKSGDKPFEAAHRDSAATGHIRQSSRYLAAGPPIEKWSVALAQASGLLINLLALSAILCLGPASFILVQRTISFLGLWPSWEIAPAAILWLSVLLLVIVGIAPLVWLRRRNGVQIADTAIAVAASSIVLVLIAIGWHHAALGLALLVGNDWARLLAVLLAPLGLLIAGVGLERLLPRSGAAGRWMARSAAPLFVAVATLSFTNLLRTYPQYAPWIAAAAVAVAAYYFLFLNLNVTGLHRHYKSKLSEAFLVVDAGPGAVKREDERTLSSLTEAHLGPYPIFNAALNVPSSQRPAMRGRLTDFFSFTPHHCGSPISGYYNTPLWEELDPDLNIATAMAISGAAISPQMGLQNRAQLSFWLSLLNVRLGYWLRNPGVRRPKLSMRPGLWYLLLELSGRMNEKSAFLNLSDGGHIENLGVYQLLRRRCKFVVVVDGEQDQNMTFHAIANLQRLAAIDLGVQIEINLDELRRDRDGLSRSHFQFCRIRYPGGHFGYLVYLKLSLTGNEGEFLRRFRLDEPDFPHHPTADQNFTEARFEAYRSLGQHVGEKLFLKSIVGEVADEPRVDIESWFASLGRSFLEPVGTIPTGTEPASTASSSIEVEEVNDQGASTPSS
jgi:hypothetical protein